MLEDHKSLFLCPKCGLPMLSYSVRATDDGIFCYKVRCAFCRSVSRVIISQYRSPEYIPKRYFSLSTVMINRKKWAVQCDCSDASADEAGIREECRFDLRTAETEFRIWYDMATRTIQLSCPAETARIYRRMIIRAMELELLGK